MPQAIGDARIQQNNRNSSKSTLHSCEQAQQHCSLTSPTLEDGPDGLTKKDHTEGVWTRADAIPSCARPASKTAARAQAAYHRRRRSRREQVGAKERACMRDVSAAHRIPRASTDSASTWEEQEQDRDPKVVERSDLAAVNPTSAPKIA
eukprot:153176-Rhodomonas_salina.7